MNYRYITTIYFEGELMKKTICWIVLAGSLPLFAGVAPIERGINLSHWFAQTRLPDYPPNAVPAEEMELLHALGMDHVRLPVDPIRLWNFSEDAVLERKMLSHIDTAVRRALEHDLNVVVDMHPRPDLKRRLREDPETFRSFLRFWEALAGHLSRFDASRVALELLNEPEVDDPAAWQAMVEQLHAVVRKAAPEHTIVIGGAAWSNTDRLQQLKPVADDNVLYTFHFYDPHIFTHQGAGWGDPAWKKVKDLPYPADAAEGAEAQPAAVKTYFREQWNADRIRAQIDEAADWAEANGVRVWCGEFGSYRKTIDAEDRIRYIRDVRPALEEHDIGWAMWDLKGGFALMKSDGGIDPAVAMGPFITTLNDIMGIAIYLLVVGILRF